MNESALSPALPYSQPVGAAAPSLADSLSDVLRRVRTTESRHLMECLTEDFNAFLSGLVRLSGKTRADPPDILKLLERFQMTLSMAAPPSPPSVEAYAPRKGNGATMAARSLAGCAVC